MSNIINLNVNHAPAAEPTADDWAEYGEWCAEHESYEEPTDEWEDDGQPSEYDEWQDYYGGDEDYSGDCEPLWNEW